VWITSSLETVQTPTVIALGNFDGVHQGHRSVIEPILRQVQVNAPVLAGAGGSLAAHPSAPFATVVTFDPHPQEFFTGQRRLLLTPIAEKAQYLESIGVQQLVLLPFDATLARLTPQEFVEQILIQGLQAQRISVGQDFRFGQQRSGTIADLQMIAAQHGVPVEVAPLHLDQGERVSSSAIRHALSDGAVEQANQLLGRAYSLVGEVVGGRQLGRTIGFPTANLQLPTDKFLPCCGVYCVWVEGATANRQPGVMNIGYRPTVEGSQITVEIHLLDWSGDLYGHTLTVSLEHFLRPEQKFAGLDDLKAQIQQDCHQARVLLMPSQS
jgi:riboflavin kinase / FMN adenylyltransferase